MCFQSARKGRKGEKEEKRERCSKSDQKKRKKNRKKKKNKHFKVNKLQISLHCIHPWCIYMKLSSLSIYIALEIVLYLCFVF
jgi:hypothetical protein